MNTKQNNTPAEVTTEATTNTSTDAQKTSGRSKQGFAGISLERRREIASMGGKEAHRKGTAHQWTTETARKAGKLGAQSRKSAVAKTVKSMNRNEL